jgi:hypothetical protein
VAWWDGIAWHPAGSGLNGEVFALCAINDGPLRGVYAGGNFTMAGGVNAARVARWDGAEWTALAVTSLIDFSDMDPVRALACGRSDDGDELYIAGEGGVYFSVLPTSYAQTIVRWDGDLFASLGVGMHAEGVGT